MPPICPKFGTRKKARHQQKRMSIPEGQENLTSRHRRDNDICERHSPRSALRIKREELYPEGSGYSVKIGGCESREASQPCCFAQGRSCSENSRLITILKSSIVLTPASFRTSISIPSSLSSLKMMVTAATESIP